MINKKDNKIEWPVMLMDLEEVKGHIDSLISQMHKDGMIHEEDFRIQIFHAITHLNRIWNSRDHSGEMDQELYGQLSQIPVDFQPVG